MSRSASRLTSQQQRALQDIIGRERVRFDRRERRVYSHDISVLPGPIRRLTGSLADGVVRPGTEEDLIGLVRYASAERIPLVPRGKGTSGYGGAVPARGGLVVDLRDLNDFVGCDPDNFIVTVGAGIVWNALESSLAEYGLGLRLYPTSAPSSTVGGWLAQGGAGIGSYAYGWFAQNVRAARVVTGEGDVHNFRSDDLAGIADAEGTTGIVTQVTLDVQPAARHNVVALTWPSSRQLMEALQLLGERAVPIWSIQFVDPAMARLSNRSRQCEGRQPYGSLPEQGYTCLVAYDVTTQTVVEDTLNEICSATVGTRDPVEVAEAQWGERFRPMRLKRLGPSLLPIEVVVPLDSLALTLEELERRINPPMALEGLLVRGNEVVLTGLLPHDERTNAYAAGHGFVISALEAAERCGGRPYSTGRLLASRSRQILGDDRLETLRFWKRKNDPVGILNPGKVFDGGGVLNHVVGAAWKAEPLARNVAGRFGRPATTTGRRAANQKILPDVIEHAYACAQCGYCVDVCPQFQEAGWESCGPRGKWFLIKDVLEGRDRFDIELTDIFGMCVHCGKCDEVCQLDLPIESSWRRVKASLFDGVLTRTS
jgi:FAD/FMN-containing dehydrogenase/ferredoxin